MTAVLVDGTSKQEVRTVAGLSHGNDPAFLNPQFDMVKVRFPTALVEGDLD